MQQFINPSHVQLTHLSTHASALVFNVLSSFPVEIHSSNDSKAVNKDRGCVYNKITLGKKQFCLWKVSSLWQNVRKISQLSFFPSCKLVYLDNSILG